MHEQSEDALVERPAIALSTELRWHTLNRYEGRAEIVHEYHRDAEHSIYAQAG